MTKAEEAALKALPQRWRKTKDGKGRVDSVLPVRQIYIRAYEQAEKDMALTWEDVPKLIELTGKTFRHYCDAGRPDVPLQELYEEVLRRFNETRR